VRPVAEVAEVRAADAAALVDVDHATLVERAGRAAAQVALEILGSAYGRRVVVVAGKGSNGADGRVAGRHLVRRGARVAVVDAATAPARLPRCDLVVDAAYGTGFRGSYEAPEVPDGVPVLAVDIPSGVDGDTGVASGRPLAADRTVTFAALKIGLVQGDGPLFAGDVTVADIGVVLGPTGVALVEDDDIAAGVDPRGRSAHKWESAVAVVAGSPGMEGAAVLAASGATHAGAGMVRLFVPGTATATGGAPSTRWPLEVVRVAVARSGWADGVLAVLDRCRAVVVGPGLGRDEETGAEIRRLVSLSPVPVVADADALFALGPAEQARSVIGTGRTVVLTPHDGEYRRLSGAAPGPDRVSAGRDLAARSGAVVLLKGPTTAVASPLAADVPDVLLAAAGDPRLATAGTGDVLSGIVGAMLARGVPANRAAAFAAHIHGRAADLGHREGLVASDLPALVSRWLSQVVGRPAQDQAAPTADGAHGADGARGADGAHGADGTPGADGTAGRRGGGRHG
jgi:NAD(P)H-hydrate epimerase